MTQPIWYDSTEAGAPSLNNAAGTLLEVLRACLVNGFGAKTVTSISVTAGVATVTCAAHGFTDTYGKLLLIAGASEPLLNGRKQPLTVSTNSFTFSAPGVADGTYTGTISARRAPLGWTEPHTGTNVAIFARSVPQATAQLLRVLDTAAAPASATDARVLMLESATGIDAYTAPSPTAGQLANGQYWSRGDNTVTAKKWAVVGDDRAFWLLTETGSTGNFSPYFFGDGVPYIAGDAYFSMLLGAISSGSGTGNTSVAFVNTLLSVAPSSLGALAARPPNGVGSATPIALAGISGNATLGSNNPVVSTSRLMVAVQQPVYVQDATRVVRGEAPGMAQPLAGAVFLQLEVLNSTLGSADTFLSVLSATAGSGTGNVLFNLSTPWY